MELKLKYTIEDVEKLHTELKYALIEAQNEYIRKKQAKGEISLAENMPILRKDGTVIYTDINSSPVEIGGKQYLIGLFRDITDRKRLEEEKLKRSNLEAINKMVVSINHEMNQPLSVLISLSETAAESVEVDKQLKEDLQTIKQEAWKLAKLVKKIQNLKDLKETDYSQGIKMIDLNEEKES